MSFGIAWFLSSPCSSTGAEPATYATTLKPFLGKYCFECHGEKKAKADLNLETFEDQTRLFEERVLWEKVHKAIHEREMPPEEKPQPTEEERARMVAFIESDLARFDCSGPVDPGRVTLRRLNRVEYRNTIRDLIGIDYNPTAEFPVDEVGYGFDNIGDVLSLPPMLMEKYLAAAEQIATRAILPVYPPRAEVRHLQGETFQIPDVDYIRALPGRGFGLYREGEGRAALEVAEKGLYLVRIRAYGEQAGPEPPHMALTIDGKEVKVFDVAAAGDEPGHYEVRVSLEPGRHELTLAYLNNYNVQDHPDPKLRGDRNLIVNWVEVEGPIPDVMPPAPASHARIFSCDPAHAHTRACARQILKQFATRAWRRPVGDSEVRGLVRLVELAQKEEATFEEGIQLAVQAVLVSPRFLFRWELDPQKDQPAGVRALSDHEVASRLSYFLWSSMPDDRLFELAAEGALLKPGVLEGEVKRMLQDPKAQALVENFGGQWLQIRNLATMTPDPEMFPGVDESLRQAMRQETELFFAAVMREDRSILEFIDADFTFLNGPLARHYGVEGVEGEAFQRVALGADSPRGGVLTHASVLTITSNPTRTSPVIRGKWILEQILGTPPPPPPPNVPLLEESETALASASLRQRLEMHRSKAECATCHNKMDAMGFAFENFDAVGRWRELDGVFPIDPSGTLPDGRGFSGPQELKKILKNEAGFARSLAEKMLTFALGRGLEYYDKCAVDDIVAALQADGQRFSVLVQAIVRSEPFRKKRVGAGDLAMNVAPPPPHN